MKSQLSNHCVRFGSLIQSFATWHRVSDEDAREVRRLCAMSMQTCFDLHAPH